MIVEEIHIYGCQSNSYLWFCVVGAKMAIDFINDDDSILPDYQLVLLVQDTQCKVDMAMKHFVQYISNVTHPIAGIVGK